VILEPLGRLCSHGFIFIRRLFYILWKATLSKYSLLKKKGRRKLVKIGGPTERENVWKFESPDRWKWHFQGRLLILYIRIYDIFITYLLRSRETVCFVDPRPPLLLEAKPIVCLIGKQTNQMRSLQTGLWILLWTFELRNELANFAKKSTVI
jgi:hypothetical protein